MKLTGLLSHGFSGNSLKVIAILAMTADHLELIGLLARII